MKGRLMRLSSRTRPLFTTATVTPGLTTVLRLSVIKMPDYTEK